MFFVCNADWHGIQIMNIKYLIQRFLNYNFEKTPLGQTAPPKEYWYNVLWNDVLPKIEIISNQPRYGYHGLEHSAQVAMFGIDIAYTIGQNPLPVILAAGLHDCARTTDGWCSSHGPNAVPIAREFLDKNYPQMQKSEKKRILYAIKKHALGLNTHDEIAACLWDADRIRLAWEMGYNPKFFSTERGREIAAFTFAQQLEYIDNQENFLVRNNIRTREQIKRDHKYNQIQNNIGTQFKNKTR